MSEGMVLEAALRPLWQVCEAEFSCSNAALRVSTEEWMPVAGMFYHRSNSIALYVPPLVNGRPDHGAVARSAGCGRFLDAHKAAIGPISSAMFRPANLAMEVYGPGGITRSVHYDFTDVRLNQVIGESLDWRAEDISAALRLNDTPVVLLMRRMMAEVLTPGFASPALLDALGIEAIVALLRHIRGVVPVEFASGSLTRRQLRQVSDRVHATDLPVPTVTDIALLLGMSDRNLLRLFKNTTGETVSAFVRRIWVDRARAMLADTALPLKEIAFRTGFSGHSGFTRAFRSATGQTPSQFRERASRRALPSFGRAAGAMGIN